MWRISPGPTRWPPGAERRLVPAKSNLRPQTCCPISFAGGVGLCPFPVCAVLRCAARRVARCRFGLRCCWRPVLWCVAVCCGVSLGVLWCAGAALVCPCVLLCRAVFCGAASPCGTVVLGCAVCFSFAAGVPYSFKNFFSVFEKKIRKKIFFLNYTLPNAHMQADSKTILGWLSYV